MGKKKKKEKTKEEDTDSSYSLDIALKGSKKTETALHSLLKAFSEDDSYVVTKEADKKIEPQLSYEAKKKIAEDYMMEEIPITEQTQIKEKISESKAIGEKESIKKEKVAPSEKTVKKTSISKKDNVYFKLSQFFEGIFQGYNERYEMWENSVSAILAILRKMRKITKKNTEDLVNSINKLHEKIQFNLEQFKIKRDEVEKHADVDIESMSSEFKKVLGLLELQIKEYQLKRLADEYVHQHRIP